MMLVFKALPVSVGDMYFVKYGSVSILFDGGRYKKQSLNLFKQYVNEDIDVLICSHNDADHANGIIEILNDISIKIKEVWLPGEWTLKLKKITEHPIDSIVSIFSELSNMGDGLWDEDKSWVKEFKREAFESDELYELDFENAIDVFKRLQFFALPISHPSKGYCFAYEILSEFTRILEIFNLAVSRNETKIRLFKYQSTAPQNKQISFLLPMNSIEHHPEIGELAFLHYLYLTRANRESLVFSTVFDSEPNILFTADSPLSGALQNPAPTNEIIITTPHHGSANNDGAYSTIQNWYSNSKKIWVRTYFPRINLSSNFKNLTDKKFCIRCSNISTKHKQIVIYNSRKSFTGNMCSC